MSPDSLTSPPKTVSLYETAVKIHPRSVSGRYNRLRVAATCTLLGLYYLIPWLQWQGRPLVLFDLPARRFHIFTLTLVPQDLLLLALLLLLAALTLFLVYAGVLGLFLSTIFLVYTQSSIGRVFFITAATFAVYLLVRAYTKLSGS